MMSKAEICQLINSFATVECSHQFKNITLDSSSRRILRTSTGIASKITEMEAYGNRMEEGKWRDEIVFLSARDIDGIATMLIGTFCCKFAIGERGIGRNLLQKRPSSSKPQVATYRWVTADPKSPDYWEFCQQSILRYNPWHGDSADALWGGAEGTPEEVHQRIIDHWTACYNTMVAESRVPQSFNRQLDRQYAADDNMTDPLHVRQPAVADPNAPVDDLTRLQQQDEAHPGTDDIVWDRNYDTSLLVHSYHGNQAPRADFAATYLGLRTNFAATMTATAQLAPGTILNEKQQLAHDMMVQMVTNTDAIKVNEMFIFILLSRRPSPHL